MKKNLCENRELRRFTAGVKWVEQRGAAEAGMMLVHGQPGFGKSRLYPAGRKTPGQSSCAPMWT